MAEEGTHREKCTHMPKNTACREELLTAKPVASKLMTRGQVAHSDLEDAFDTVLTGDLKEREIACGEVA